MIRWAFGLTVIAVYAVATWIYSAPRYLRWDEFYFRSAAGLSFANVYRRQDGKIVIPPPDKYGSNYTGYILYATPTECGGPDPVVDNEDEFYLRGPAWVEIHDDTLIANSDSWNQRGRKPPCLIPPMLQAEYMRQKAEWAAWRNQP